MKVYVIAGHGPNDPGAIGFVNGEKYIERELTKQLAKLVQPNEKYRFTFDKDAYIETRELVKTIPFDTDIVIEIHFNSFSQEKANGVEAYYNGYHKLHNKIVNLKNTTDTLVRSISKLGFSYRKIAPCSFKVMNFINYNVALPAILLEVCFVSNSHDMKIYNAEKTAKVIREVFYMNEEKQEVSKWATGAVKWAKETNIMSDDSRPKDNVTREELASILYRLENRYEKKK